MTAGNADTDPLAEVLWSREYRHAPALRDEPAEVQQGFREDAEFILASDWLAAHDAGVRADERQRIAALLADETTVEKVADALYDARDEAWSATALARAAIANLAD